VNSTREEEEEEEALIRQNVWVESSLVLPLCQMVFSQDRHEDVLDMCLVQFEPDSSDYIRVR